VRNVRLSIGSCDEPCLPREPGLSTAAGSTDLIAAHCGSAGACSQMFVCTSKEVHDVGAIAIVPNVGDAYDNALAESFLDSYKPS
jgi:hypothetical protein